MGEEGETSSSFHPLNKSMYLFFYGMLGLPCCMASCLVTESKGYSLL